MEDTKSVFCLETGSSAWMLKSPRIITLGYCNFQAVAASSSPGRAYAGALGVQYTKQMANFSTESHPRPTHSIPGIVGAGRAL